MQRLLLIAAISLAASAPASAHRHLELSCSVHSNYGVSLDGDGLRFEREKGSPGKVVMHAGHLRIDGRELSLSDADHRRVAEYEATVRALVPQAKIIARDAIGIAFTAVSEVAVAFSSDANHSDVRDRLDRVRSGVLQKVDESFDKRPWQQSQLDDIVESTVSELVPVLVGDIAGTAIRIALSGDEAAAKELERRSDKLEHDIERRIDTQTEQLAARAEALCPMVAQLASIEASLELRLDGGARLDLLSQGRD
ncbi:MAG: DUF2884 family protein [Tahibacter sp.]